jgi:DNA-binding response OmpR family regulator
MVSQSRDLHAGLSLRVLVVEDDPDTLASLCMLLRLYGHDVERACDGPSACQAAQASPPDVVLLDIGLPKMDGWRVAKQIREQCRWKRPLIVAITGHGREADRLQSDEVGIDLHLVKPVDPEILDTLLRRFQRIVLDPQPVAQDIASD